MKVEIFGFRYGSGNFMADRQSAGGRKLMAVEGAGPIWARYYQIGTDKPIFGDRDKTIHDDVNELSLERRNGYSWFNARGHCRAERVQDLGADASAAQVNHDQRAVDFACGARM